MSNLAEIADPRYVVHQYQNATNLNVRIELHRRFSTNKYGWPRWVFDQFAFPPQSRILELGCGPGDLWLENSDRLPAKWEIVLSDFSPGMAHHAQNRLGGHHAFRFGVLEAQTLPFANGSFDGVIANHMLYHVPDRAKALAEIRRVLKPMGHFYASTLGQHDMHALADLISRFDPQLANWRTRLTDTFTLENGSAQLAREFTHVTLHRYADSLIVTEAAPLVNYILSGRITLNADRQRDLTAFVEQELQQNGGKLHITKDAGMFEAV